MSKNISWVARVDDDQYQQLLDLVADCRGRATDENKHLFDEIEAELVLKIMFNPNDIGKNREK